MEIAPLALVVLLGYGLLIAVSLTTWTAVTYRDEPTAEVRRPEVKKSRPAKARQLSNDDVRGAKSRRARGSELFEQEPLVQERQVEPVAQSEPVGTQPASSAPEVRPRVKRKPVTVSADEADEDAFERFLGKRPDDFDIR